MPEVLKNLLSSEKAIVVLLFLAVAGALVFTGKLDAVSYLDYSKWLIGIYVGGKAIQGAASSIADGMAAKALANQPPIEEEKK